MSGAPEALQFPPLSIKCDTGVKQHRDAFKPSLESVPPGPPNRRRNTLFDPDLFDATRVPADADALLLPSYTLSAREKFRKLANSPTTSLGRIVIRDVSATRPVVLLIHFALNKCGIHCPELQFVTTIHFCFCELWLRCRALVPTHALA